MEWGWGGNFPTTSVGTSVQGAGGQRSALREGLGTAAAQGLTLHLSELSPLLCDGHRKPCLGGGRHKGAHEWFELTALGV